MASAMLGIREDDLVFSAAKLFFAYGLGNGLTFPLAVGATTVLMGERPTPQAVFQRLRQHKPTIFYGVPTLYGALLASPDMLKRERGRRAARLHLGRRGLPADIGRRWTERSASRSSTASAPPRCCTSSSPIVPAKCATAPPASRCPGYEVRLIGEDGNPVARARSANCRSRARAPPRFYWNNREKSRHTFMGDWTRSGDKYIESADGYFQYCGRSDDMLKVSGIYVSPFEVEGALMTHEAMLEAAVVAHADTDELIKPKAYVVLKPGIEASEELSEALKQHVKEKLAPYKYPRWIEFVTELPKTATGKIQRFKLR
jgi:benzoate-CoA ligase